MSTGKKALVLLVSILFHVGVVGAVGLALGGPAHEVKSIEVDLEAAPPGTGSGSGRDASMQGSGHLAAGARRSVRPAIPPALKSIPGSKKNPSPATQAPMVVRSPRPAPARKTKTAILKPPAHTKKKAPPTTRTITPSSPAAPTLAKAAIVESQSPAVTRPVPHPVEETLRGRKIQPSDRKPVMEASPIHKGTAAESVTGNAARNDAAKPLGGSTAGVNQEDVEASTTPGTGGSGPPGGGNDRPTDLQAYFTAIRTRIEAAKQYPGIARRRRIQGSAVVSFRLSAEGKLLGARIQKSSGHRLLDRAALDAIRDGAPYPSFPGKAPARLPPFTLDVAFVLR